ncbi:uncharacterized protein N7459_001993 [Penicillium hispanicum]|uniref:uncharacterized protein n=1 Tax=Penicillium hispanicum TaxID=1080232 RepID=UPI0025412938|nr:uncharacterized protein N7459_001993 [Penicillium hispanicum]KAJ5591624.1 hypothetical protein N7459_001993 [Penicillium hispanicum]
MVGVPGRSRGCKTCRRRKKGCDLQHPTCGQCQRAGLECEGYVRERIFVNSTQGPSVSGAPRLEQATYPTSNPVPALVRRRVAASADLKPGILTHESLWRSASQMNMVGTFWATFLPNSQPFSLRAARFANGGWTNVAQEIYQDDTLVRHALMANCLGLVGRQDGHAWMVQEGMRIYGLTLNRVGMLLKQPDKVHSKTIVLVPMMLSLFELMLGADEQKFIQFHRWHSHAVGTSSIILMRPPGDYATGVAHRIFIEGRLHAMLGEFLRRKRSKLSAPEWKTAPWSEIPKTPKDALMDIMIDLPGLMELYDTMQATTDLGAKLQLAHELFEQCWVHHRELQEWAATVGKQGLAFAETIIGIPEPQLLNPTTEQFALANLGTLYWTGCAILYDTLQRAAIRIEVSLPRKSPRTYVHKVAQIVPYFQAPGIGHFYQSMVAVPVGLCLHVLYGLEPLSQPSPERLLLQRAFSGTLGSDMERFLDGALSRSKVNGQNDLVVVPPAQRDLVVPPTQNLAVTSTQKNLVVTPPQYELPLVSLSRGETHPLAT